MHNISRRRLLIAGGTGAALVGVAFGGDALLAQAQPARPGPGADIVLGWNRTLLRILRTPGAQPATVHATRSFAILHAAIYDAVVAAAGTGRPYRFEVNHGAGAAPEAASAQAAHDTLAALYPVQQADLAQQLA